MVRLLSLSIIAVPGGPRDRPASSVSASRPLRGLVGVDDLGHERVPHDVALIEPNDSDAGHTLELRHGVYRPDGMPGGRSVWVGSPVTTMCEFSPRRVRNIFICDDGVVFMPRRG